MAKKIDKMKEEKKIESYKVNLKERDTVSPTFGKFPMKQWSEWDQDCEMNFNGTRWMKAIHDHQKARQSMKEEAMWEYMMGLKNQIDLLQSSMEKPQETKPETIETLGATYEVKAK